MPASRQNSDELRDGAARRGTRWDAMAAIIASLVGLLALVVAGYTAYIQRQQVRAQVWPYLQMGQSNAGGHYELVAINRGVGPVVIRSVQVLVDGKPVSNWRALFQSLRFIPTGSPIFSTLNQTVLAPGSEVQWAVFQNATDIDALTADWARFHVEARVCYASTLGENWLTVYRPGWVGGYRPRPVSKCPSLPDSEQFSD